MSKARTFVLPPRPLTTLWTRLPSWRRPQVLQKYVLDVGDALVRACRAQTGAVLPSPAVISAHFEAFTVEQAKSFSLFLHQRYGVALQASGVRA